MKHQIQHPRPQAQRNKGFTLVEILVVLAIITILAGILFPVFRNAREGARASACASNLKQLGMAFTQYALDHGGRLPGGANYQQWGDGGHWVKGTNNEYLAELADGDGDGEFPYRAGKTADVQGGALFRYVKEASVYVCPSNEDGEAKKLTYSMNCAISGAPSNRVRLPSSTVLLIDEWRASDGYFWAANDPASTDTITKDHIQAGNLLFLDGHVKSYTNESFPLDASAQGLANKIAGSTAANEPAQSSTPRFRDRALGADGAYEPSPFNSNTANPNRDACEPRV